MDAAVLGHDLRSLLLVEFKNWHIRSLGRQFLLVPGQRVKFDRSRHFPNGERLTAKSRGQMIGGYVGEVNNRQLLRMAIGRANVSFSAGLDNLSMSAQRAFYEERNPQVSTYRRHWIAREQ